MRGAPRRPAPGDGACLALALTEGGARPRPPSALTGSCLTQRGGGGCAQGAGGEANRLAAPVDVRVGGGGCSPFSPVRGGAGGRRRYAQPAARCSRGRRGGGALRARRGGGTPQARPGLAGASRAVTVPFSVPLRDTAMRQASVVGPHPAIAAAPRESFGLPQGRRWNGESVARRRRRAGCRRLG